MAREAKQKNDDDVMPANCDLIFIFPIYGQLGAIRKPDSGRIVCKTYIFLLVVTFILQKLKTEPKNLCHSCHTIVLNKVIFLPKSAEFLQKPSDISKIKGVLALKGIFSETICVCTYV